MLEQPQTSIVSDGFRSLKDGEDVEFYQEEGTDGRRKAVQVTGPNGAPPIVSSMRLAAGLQSLLSSLPQSL